MKKPTPRKTSIFASKTIKGLFYEGFKKNGIKKLNSDDQIIAIHYNGERFDLLEFVEIVPYLDCDFQKIEERPLLGRIVEIEPENEAGRGQKLILRINDCESEKQDLFQITEIRKERIE